MSSQRSLKHRSRIASIVRVTGAALPLLVATPMNASPPLFAADGSQYQMGSGIAAYLGVVPAELIRGHPPKHPEATMHGGAPHGRNEVHLFVAIFDASTGARITDAKVKAQVSGLGLSGSEYTLEPMTIANSLTYGNFLSLPGRDLYAIKVTIVRSGTRESTVMNFKYDNRAR